MNRPFGRVAGGLAAVAVLAGALFVYASHPVRGSDHQDSPTMIQRPGADITDAYIFPAPDNIDNVVLVMDSHPLIPAGMGTSTFFDPAVMYQFKIDNVGDKTEHLVIQFVASGANAQQQLTMFGPAAPRLTGTQSVAVTRTGSFAYNAPTKLPGGIQVFAGPRKDPFFFDLSQFFKIIPDRNAGYHPPLGSSVPPPSAASFRGFPAGSACDITPAVDFLSSNRFNVLSIVVELPKTLLAPAGGTPGKISVWTTASTVTGS